jgi:hypothetical protein
MDKDSACSNCHCGSITLKDSKTDLWNYYKEFVALSKKEQDFFLYGRLMAIHIKPGDKEHG